MEDLTFSNKNGIVSFECIDKDKEIRIVVEGKERDVSAYITLSDAAELISFLQKQISYKNTNT